MEKTTYPNAACLDFERGLAAYLEGEPAPLVQAHAQECPYCRVILADLKAIAAAGARLEEEQPSRRLWANIRATLIEEGLIRKPARARWSWLEAFALAPSPAPVATVAALAFLAVLLTLHSASFHGSLSPERPPVDLAETSADAPQLSALAHTVEAMQASYRLREKTLDVLDKVVYQKGLDSLDTSIDECRNSVRREPANSLARDYLLAAYTQKAEVLASALEIEGR